MVCRPLAVQGRINRVVFEMVILPIEYYPESQILLTEAKPVVSFDGELCRLATDMKRTMSENKGVGLAAPQVGYSIRMFVALDVQRQTVCVFVNPIILSCNNRLVSDTEGCLSIPGWSGEVKRHSEVTVQYQNLNGVWEIRDASGMLARVIQHEIDHLDGILFPQRVHFQRTGKWIQLQSHHHIVDKWRLDTDWLD
jgi:peptide deformylase